MDARLEGDDGTTVVVLDAVSWARSAKTPTTKPRMASVSRIRGVFIVCLIGKKGFSSGNSSFARNP